MVQAATKGGVVCLVVQNSLAEAYLRQVLSPIGHPRVLSLDQLDGISPWHRRNIVFIVDVDGLDVPLSVCLRQLQTFCPGAKFLLLGPDKSAEEIAQFLILGSHGFVAYAAVPNTLGQAILRVAANKLWGPPEALHRFLCEANSVLRKDVPGKLTRTPREVQVLELIRLRLSNKEIAQLLHIRLTTVKFHVSNILSKMHARTRRDLLERKSMPLWRILAS